MKEKRSAVGGAKAARASGGAGKADAQTEQLKKITRKLGNAQVQEVIGRNDKARDAIYQFILHRLQKMHQVQQREKEAMKKQRVWFDEVAHKKAGFGLPDPTRWREPAGEYKQAAESIARGNLGQAVQHLERAIEAENKAREELPKEIPLDHEEARPAVAPGQMADVKAGEGCNPREVHEALRLADEIERVSAKSKAEGVFRPRLHWWDTPEVADGEEAPKGRPGRKRAATEEPEAERKPAEADKEVLAEEKEEREEEQAVEKGEEKGKEKGWESADGKAGARAPPEAAPAVVQAGPAPPVRKVNTRVKRG